MTLWSLELGMTPLSPQPCEYMFSDFSNDEADAEPAKPARSRREVRRRSEDSAKPREAARAGCM